VDRGWKQRQAYSPQAIAFQFIRHRIQRAASVGLCASDTCINDFRLHRIKRHCIKRHRSFSGDDAHGIAHSHHAFAFHKRVDARTWKLAKCGLQSVVLHQGSQHCGVVWQVARFGKRLALFALATLPVAASISA